MPAGKCSADVNEPNDVVVELPQLSWRFWGQRKITNLISCPSRIEGRAVVQDCRPQLLATPGAPSMRTSPGR
jgi:hypothetical protein